jgi:hypothetical protein
MGHETKLPIKLSHQVGLGLCLKFPTQCPSVWTFPLLLLVLNHSHQHQPHPGTRLSPISSQKDFVSFKTSLNVERCTRRKRRFVWFKCHFYMGNLCLPQVQKKLLSGSSLPSPRSRAALWPHEERWQWRRRIPRKYSSCTDHRLVIPNRPRNRYMPPFLPNCYQRMVKGRVLPD